MRRATPTSTSEPQVQGDPAAALAGATRVIEAEYEVPFQGHSAIGPAHALADPSDGQMTIYSNDMKAYGLRNGVAKFLDMPREKVRVVYMDGPQVYGRTAADDAGFEAAFLAKELGRPVRMQWMRDEETAWDTKGPALRLQAARRAGRSGQSGGARVRRLCRGPQPPRVQRTRHGADCAAHGPAPRAPGQGQRRSAVRDVRHSEPAHDDACRRAADDLGDAAAHRQSARSQWAAGDVRLRVVHRRAGRGGQGRSRAVPPRYAGRQAKEDDVFRKARSLAVVRAAAKAYGWDARPSPKPRAAASRGKVLSGRGIAYTYRSNTIAAVIAEVEVNRETGRVWVKRLVCAHDCGLAINPEGLRHTVECGMLHGLSRALWEEVTVRYRECHQRRLGFIPQPAAFGHARGHRRRAGQRRSQSGPPRPARPTARVKAATNP